MAAPLSLAAAQGPRSRDEYVLKAQILVQMAGYVKWPEPARSGKPFVIAIIGVSPFGGFLAEYAAKHTIHGRPIEIQSWAWSRQPRDCDLAFICRSEHGAMAEILNWAGERPVLTACESAGQTNEGVMVGVVLATDRVKIYLNRQAMADKGFVVSSQLLGVATLVGPDRPSR